MGVSFHADRAAGHPHDALSGKLIAPHDSYITACCIRKQVAVREHSPLPPERHVIEVVRPPYSGSFIINGAAFTAKTPACWDWTAGERVRLVAGDWHGWCRSAVFYNMSRRRACGMWCW